MPNQSEVPDHVKKLFWDVKKDEVDFRLLQLYRRSLTYFADADGEPDPFYLGSKKFAWEDIKAFFIKNVREFEKALLK